MNQRQKQILQVLINKDDYVTAQSLANQFNISLRTVHNDIKVIENILLEHDVKLDKKPRVGIQIKAPLSIKKSLLNYIDPHKETVDILSTKIRRMKIFARLLLHNEGTSLNKLSDEFMVSKTSIVTDFEIVEKQAEKSGLKLIKDHKGTRIEGDEVHIRHALSQLASDFVQLEFEEEELEDKPSRLDLSTYYRLKNIFDIDHIEIVENIVIEAEKKLGYTINDLSYVNLITHLLILIKRLKMSVTYSEDEANQVFTLDVIEKSMAIAHYIANEISHYFSVNIPESEVKYIHQYLVCSGIQSDFIHLNIDTYALDIKDEYIEIVDKMISFVSDAVHYDLRHDKELKLSLLTHIIPLLQRIKYDVKIDNPLIEETKVQYSAMFSIVTLAIDMIKCEPLKHLSQDEIGFLTIHFQAAVERSMQQKRVIIVCPEGIGFSRLIAHRIERFVSSVSIVDIVSMNQLNHMNLDNIDFVISTSPIKQCQKPVILVSSFISELDIRGINNFLVENAQTQNHHHFENLSQIIDESVIYVQLDFHNKNEVIDYLCDQMCNHHYVSQEYKKTVFQREDIMSTDLGNHIAIPHGSEKEIICSKIAIATLKEPIVWDKHEVQIIFLIAMNMENPQWTKNVLKDLYSIMDSKTTLQSILDAQDETHILNIFK